jgi:hypothetical protein
VSQLSTRRRLPDEGGASKVHAGQRRPQGGQKRTALGHRQQPPDCERDTLIAINEAAAATQRALEVLILRIEAVMPQTTRQTKAKRDMSRRGPVPRRRGAVRLLVHEPW